MKTENRNVLGRRIAPGFWEDADGNMHISVAELLELFELEDSPENREIVTANIRKMMREQNPESEIIERQTWSD